MDICTLIAIVSCRMSIHFCEPTVEWACGRIVVNDLMVVDSVDDKEFFGEVLGLLCVEDFDGEDLWSSLADGPACSARPRPALVVGWGAGRSASTSSEFIGAVYAIIRKGFRAFSRMIAEPVCGYAPVVGCNEGRPGLHARPLTSTHRASQALHSIMLDGNPVRRDQVDEECEWLGTDGRFAAEAEQWYDDYCGIGQSSCERQRIDRGWENPTDRHTGVNTRRMERDRQRRLGRRIKQEVQSC